MVAFPKIDSRHNPSYKEWKRYVRRPQEAECPWIALEGWKAISDVAAVRPPELLLCSRPDRPEFDDFSRRAPRTFLLPEKLLRDLSTVESFQGVVAFFRKPVWEWDELPPRLLFAWRLRDPGNLGTLLRTARAAGFGVVCGPESVSCFNPKTVRGSAAGIFFTPFRENVDPGQLRARGHRLIAATADQGPVFWDADWTPPFALAIGNEGSGLDDELMKMAEHRVHIPMNSASESLNAAVAGSLLAYEAIRPRTGPAADRNRDAAVPTTMTEK